MAISVNVLLNNMDLADLSSYTTASITPVADRLHVIAIDQRINAGVSGGPQQPSVTGCGLTWVQVLTQPTSGATPNRRLTILRACGPSPSSGTLTISFSGETQTHCSYVVMDFPGAVASGTNGSNGIVQSAAANDGGVLGTTATVTLSAAPSSPNNITLGYGFNTGPSTITAGSGYVSRATGSESEHGTYYMVETKLADQTANMTWSTSNSWVIGAVEVKANIARPMFRGI